MISKDIFSIIRFRFRFRFLLLYPNSQTPTIQIQPGGTIIFEFHSLIHYYSLNYYYCFVQARCYHSEHPNPANCKKVWFFVPKDYRIT